MVRVNAFGSSRSHAMEISNESDLKKPKRLTSVVWNHFERVRKSDICYAVCLHCNKKLSGSSNSGTTHLRNHLIRCLKRSNYDVSQLLSAKRRKKESTLANISYDDGQRKEDYIKPVAVKYDHEIKHDEIISLGSSKFDQERSQIDLARMIILHGYPLDMVDHVGFKVFVKNLQPLFDITCNSAVELSCMEVYGKEREKVREALRNLQGRINISVEMWSSTENAEYLSLMAHYIDEDWRLKKKILSFVTLDPSYTDDMLSEVIISCLMEWEVDCKLFAIAFDDCSTDDGIVVKIREKISHNRPLSSTRQLFDVCSAAHALNDIFQCAIKALRELNDKIRGSVRYIKSSKINQEKLNEFARQVGIHSPKSLVLDYPDRWNSTYLMVEAALEYRGAFSLLKEHDPLYTSSLSDAEWDWASSVCGYLKILFEIMNVLSSDNSRTANIYFPDICHVHIQLIDWCKNPDDFISNMARKMKAEFDKYWNKCSLALAVAVILDPRFKMKLVEYYYSQIYGSTALDRIKEVSDGIKQLFNAYTICSTSVDQGTASPGSNLPSASNDSRDRLKGFDKFLRETSQGQSAESDLDKYLEEPVFPRNCDFNILNWWKVHTPRYPVLSMMARDVLGTPMSTLSPESAFNSGGRVLDQVHSSLNPDIRQGLICTRHWLQTESEELKSSPTHAVALYVETS